MATPGGPESARSGSSDLSVLRPPAQNRVSCSAKFWAGNASSARLGCIQTWAGTGCSPAICVPPDRFQNLMRRPSVGSMFWVCSVSHACEADCRHKGKSESVHHPHFARPLAAHSANLGRQDPQLSPLSNASNSRSEAEASSKYALTRLRQSSASSRDARLAEPTRSQNMTVIGRRSAEVDCAAAGRNGWAWAGSDLPPDDRVEIRASRSLRRRKLSGIAVDTGIGAQTPSRVD